MFERYTERARRALFYARVEAYEIGGNAVEAEHLLLGVIRESKGFTSELFARAQLSLDATRSEIQARLPLRDKLPTSVELPFSPEVQRVLRFAAEEAERLGHNYVGTEHLLLSLLHEPDSIAGRMLVEKRIELETVRQGIVRMTQQRSS